MNAVARKMSPVTMPTFGETPSTALKKLSRSWGSSCLFSESESASMSSLSNSKKLGRSFATIFRAGSSCIFSASNSMSNLSESRQDADAPENGCMVVGLGMLVAYEVDQIETECRLRSPDCARIPLSALAWRNRSNSSNATDSTGSCSSVSIGSMDIEDSVLSDFQGRSHIMEDSNEFSFPSSDSAPAVLLRKTSSVRVMLGNAARASSAESSLAVGKAQEQVQNSTAKSFLMECLREFVTA